MAAQHHDEDVDMSMIVDAEELPLSIERASRRAEKRPMVRNNEAEDNIQDLGKESDGPEENRIEEDLDEDLGFENQGSNQKDEAQHQSSSSTIVTKRAKTSQAKWYEIKLDNAGNEWFCAAGVERQIVYHSDIRYDLQQYADLSMPRGGPHYESMLGAGTDDKTSYHPLFDFCGEERDDRPDCLFCLKPPSTRDDKPTNYLTWNSRVVLDYRGEPIRDLALPLTISSEIGQEAARLEAMLRPDSSIGWEDILARILRRGDILEKARKTRNALNMQLVRFRKIARLISRDPTDGSTALEAYFLATTTAEVIAKNNINVLFDLGEKSGEKQFINLLNHGIRNETSQDQENKNSKQKKSKKQQKSEKEEDLEKEKKKEEERIKRARSELRQAEKWAQVLRAWEAQNPIPAPSIYGETKWDSIESIVAFKIASLDQHRRDGSIVSKGWFTCTHAAPAHQFDNPRMEAFFGSQAYCHDEAFLLPDPNDPYGVLSGPNVTAEQICAMDFLLEPARMQYRKATLVDDGSGGYKPVFTTNQGDSYWQQLQNLQSAFEQHWAEVGRDGNPPVLHGVLKLDYEGLTWNTDEVPVLALVCQTIDSCTKKFRHWQGRQFELQREKLIQRGREPDDDERRLNSGGQKDNEDGDDPNAENGKGDEDDVEMEEGGGGEEDIMEVDSEKEEEL